MLWVLRLLRTLLALWIGLWLRLVPCQVVQGMDLVMILTFCRRKKLNALRWAAISEIQ
jgi:hypothetical protein